MAVSSDIRNIKLKKKGVVRILARKLHFTNANVAQRYILSDIVCISGYGHQFGVI